MNEKEEKLKTEQVEQTKNKTEKTKKKGKIILIVILLIIAIAIGLYFGYQKLALNPLNFYTKVINKTYDLANNFLEENFKDAMYINLNEEPLTINTSFTLDTNMEELSALKNYEYNLSLGLDVPKKQLNLSLGLSENTETIINLLLSFVNDKAYMKSDELYDQVLDLGPSELDFSDLHIEEVNYSYEDLNITLNKMKSILINSLDSNKFTISDEAITVNNSQINAKKITYTLDRENIKRTINYIREEIRKDDELMTALSHIIGLSISDLEDILQEDVDYSNYENIDINLFTNGGTKVIAGNVITKEEAIVRFTNQDGIFNMFIGDDYNNFIIKSENDTVNITYNEYDEEVFALIFTTKDDSNKIELAMNNYGDELNIMLEISNRKFSESAVSSDFTFHYNMNSYGEEINLDMKGNLEITKEELESIDTANSVDANSLTEEETLIFYENVLNIFEKLNLSELVETI